MLLLLLLLFALYLFGFVAAVVYFKSTTPTVLDLAACFLFVFLFGFLLFFYFTYGVMHCCIRQSLERAAGLTEKSEPTLRSVILRIKTHHEMGRI